MSSHGLESPESPDHLYLALDEDVESLEHRPLFTGDIVQVRGADTLAVLQHPCSMRRGSKLVERLLVAEVRRSEHGSPSDWSKHQRRMFLPGLRENETWSIEFDQLDVVQSVDALSAKRIAILSQIGVNLLLQRYVNHLSRVIVPTARINETITGQFEEADLTGDALEELVGAGVDASTAAELVDGWFGEGNRGETRRDALLSPQHRSGIRRALRDETKHWISETQQ